MIVALLLVQAFLCLSLLYNEFVLKKVGNFATSFFYLTYFVVYIVVPIVLHVFFGGARSIVGGATDYLPGKAPYILFNVCGITLLVSSLAISVLRRRAPFHEFVKQPATNSDKYVALLIIAGFFVFVYSTQMSFGELLAASRFAWTTTTDTPFLIFLNALSVYLIALSPFYIYKFNTSSNGSRLLLFICIAAIVMYAVVTKDRKFLFYLVSGWVAARYVLDGCRLRIKVRHVAIGTAMFAVMFVTNFARDMLPRYFLGEDVDLIPDIGEWLGDYFQFGDLSYFYRATIEAIHQNTDNGFLVPLALLRRIVFFFLPTQYSAGLKVEDISAIFSDVVGGEDALRRGSQPPGLFGLFVISFGVVATVGLMPLFAFFISWLDWVFRERRSLFRDVLLSFYLACLAYAFRGDESTSFYLPVVNFFVLLFVRHAAKMASSVRIL